MGEARHFAGTLSSSDQAGLAVAIILHAAVAGLLVWQMRWKEDPPPEPVTQSMTVSLATEVSLEATAPDPAAVARAESAPVVGEEVSEPIPREIEPVREPERPQVPTPRSSAKPRPQPTSRPTPRSSSTPRPNTPRPTPSRNPGSTDFDKAFNKGPGNSPTSQNTGTPKAVFGQAERNALSSAITRALRPHWAAPSGLDAEKLVSKVTWNLNPDGSLRGTPRCRTDPASITDSNRPQAGLHCERAIRAVQRAAPFKLPEQFYDRWKALEWQFDRRL